jgi:rubrerythrin
MIEPILKIIEQKELLSSLLNTLSLMELCGAQKLSRLIPELGSHTFFLEHVAEEYRHAYFLRVQAEKILDRQIPGFKNHEILAAAQSRRYINNIERSISILLKKENLYDCHKIKWRVYILSTLVIEKRALAFYQEFQDALTYYNIGISVKSVIAEEKKHLDEILHLAEKDPAILPLLNACQQIEDSLFERWISAISNIC